MKGFFYIQNERVKKVQEQLLNLQEVALNEIKDASSIEAVENLRVKYLGKKGELTAILKEMGKLSAEERPLAVSAWSIAMFEY